MRKEQISNAWIHCIGDDYSKYSVCCYGSYRYNNYSICIRCNRIGYNGSHRISYLWSNRNSLDHHLCMSVLCFLCHQRMPMRIWNDLCKTCKKKRQKLLSWKIQATHTGNCPAVVDTCNMWRDRNMEFLFMVAGWACFGFYHRIMDYSANSVDETWLRWLPSERWLPLDGTKQ